MARGQILFNDIRRLDLHGMSLENAKSAVNQIIQEAVDYNIGTVHIVTGRGNHIGP